MNENAFDPNAAAKPGSGIFGLPFTEEESKVVVLPIPFEATVSYHHGTSMAPAAILAASQQVDLYDIRLGEVWRAGIFMSGIPDWILQKSQLMQSLVPTILELEATGADEDKRFSLLRQVFRDCVDVQDLMCQVVWDHLDRGKTVFTLGGDHSTAFPAIKAHVQRYPEMGVLQIDAHCDLREAYEGLEFSHASVFWNVMQMTKLAKLVQVGIRDFGKDEYDVVMGSEGRIETFFWDNLSRYFLEETLSWARICDRIARSLPHEVYISCDIDGFDPALCPHTGTPVPGGLSFDQFCFLLSTIVRSGRTIVGGDLVEVAPGPDGDDWDANVGSRVLYKMIGYTLYSQK